MLDDDLTWEDLEEELLWEEWLDYWDEEEEDYFF